MDKKDAEKEESCEKYRALTQKEQDDMYIAKLNYIKFLESLENKSNN